MLKRILQQIESKRQSQSRFWKMAVRLKEMVPLWLKDWIRNRRKQRKSRVLRKNGLRILSETMACCQRAGITPFLVEGTLLGHHRENGFLHPDQDIDLGILESDIDKIPILEAEMAKTGYRVKKKHEYIISFKKDTYPHVDIHFFFKREGGIISYFQKRSSLLRFDFPETVFEKLEKTLFKGIIPVRIPGKVEEYLRHGYGDWEVPRRREFVYEPNLRVENMRAVILAAGKATRLYPLTLEKPKCLLEVGGRAIIDRQLEILAELGIMDIVVITGYKSEVIREYLGKRVAYRQYDGFENSNNLYTLNSIGNELDREFICLFADLIVDKTIMIKLIKSEFDFSLLIDKKIRPGTMRVKVKNGLVKQIGNHVSIKRGHGNFIGLAKFSAAAGKKMALEMEKMVKQGNQDQYYTCALESLAEKGEKISVVETDGGWWEEIDTLEDLKNAEQQFSQPGTGRN